MKKIVLFILLFLFMNTNPFAAAKDYSDNSAVSIKNVSSDPQIIKAMMLMKDFPASESYDIILGKNPTNKIIKISFMPPDCFVYI